MYEMLANQYFLARNFTGALAIFEKLVTSRKVTREVHKKLIICYTETNQLDKALLYFNKLIKKDITLIVNTDIEDEDCPCMEIIEKVHQNPQKYENDFNINLALGILWLYCSIENSLSYLQKAAEMADGKQTMFSELLEDSINIINIYKNTITKRG